MSEFKHSINIPKLLFSCVAEKKNRNDVSFMNHDGLRRRDQTPIKNGLMYKHTYSWPNLSLPPHLFNKSINNS